MLAACAPAREPADVRSPVAAASPAVIEAPGRDAPRPTAEGSPPEPASDPLGIAEALEQVARRHALTVKRPVPGRVVSRTEAIERIVTHARRDTPPEALVAMQESFVALDLAPPDYPLVDGFFALVKENVAGFYDADEDTMFLLEGLPDGSREETLTHELVHALQDQHFQLGERLDYRPGEADRLAATSCLAEGDASSAMFDAVSGAMGPPPDVFRLMLVGSVAFSDAGRTAPPALTRMLVAPYFDGYAFVEALRTRGGWAEVNRVWADPPTSTEQVLHLAKYDAHEPPLVVPPPSSSALGPGFRRLEDDVFGEQAVRIVFEQWASSPEAEEAAAGWGGDRYALFERVSGDRRDYAFAWHLRFDDTRHAAEAANTLQRHLPPCRQRAALGPIAWRRKGADVAVVSGPYRRAPGGAVEAVEAADCPRAKRWLDEILR